MYRQILIILVLGCVVATGCNSTRMLSRGDKSMQKGRYKEAIAYYDKGMKRKDNYGALLNKGIAQWRVREYSNAEKSFTDAINVSPENAPLAYYYRAELEFKSGDIQDSLQDINISLIQDPLNVQALNLRGRIHVLESRYLAAIEDFSAAITIEGESRVAGYLYHNRSIAYIGEDNFESARNDCEQYIRFLRTNNLPITVEDNYLLGVLQYAADDKEGALASWRHMPTGEREKIKNIIGNSNSMYQF
ncbi:MAG: tetratricopeptide repeat protein [Candidatus Brocadiaceae bacterium]|nr:tetratricopeptide repeat protein [Candidatus Brocadiaceae bacterium]